MLAQCDNINEQWPSPTALMARSEGKFEAVVQWKAWNVQEGFRTWSLKVDFLDPVVCFRNVQDNLECVWSFLYKMIEIYSGKDELREERPLWGSYWRSGRKRIMAMKRMRRRNRSARDLFLSWIQRYIKRHEIRCRETCFQGYPSKCVRWLGRRNKFL